jgi:NADH pyrophosphatase NudC (nudix superfamily)
MAKDTPAVEIPAHLRPVLQAAAKNLLHHLYGPQGPAWGTRFAEMEQLVKHLSDYLGSELLQQALQRQADQPVPEPLRHCPTCGRPIEPREAEPRSVQTDRGLANWQEPAAFCEHCRKSFFPSVQEPGH